jgi:uncharacterized NAD(P)/FAD-binding protein YdhS
MSSSATAVIKFRSEITNERMQAVILRALVYYDIDIDDCSHDFLLLLRRDCKIHLNQSPIQVVVLFDGFTHSKAESTALIELTKRALLTPVNVLGADDVRYAHLYLTLPLS